MIYCLILCEDCGQLMLFNIGGNDIGDNVHDCVAGEI